MSLAIAAYNTNTNGRWMTSYIEKFPQEWQNFVETITTKLVVPLLAGLIVLLLWKAYNVTLWKLIARLFYEAGWWIYGIESVAETGHETNNDRSKTQSKLVQQAIGIFCIDLSGDRPCINHAESYYYKDKKFEIRGQWRSDNVCLTHEDIEILFEMQLEPEAMSGASSTYKGAVLAYRRDMEPICGKSCWRGHFHNLSGRFVGKVYSEKLRFSHNSRDKALNEARDHALKLIGRASQGEG
jgi:hypothetical protein